MGLVTFTAGTTAVAADVNSNFSFNKQKVFLLGKGSGTTTTSGISTLGNFTTGRTISHGVIVFEMSWVTDGSNCSPGLDIVGGTSAAPFAISGGGTNNGTSHVRGYMQSSNNFMWTGTAGGTGGAVAIYNAGFSVTSADDTVYVKVDKAGTESTAYQWRAYLIADTEE